MSEADTDEYPVTKVAGAFKPAPSTGDAKSAGRAKELADLLIDHKASVDQAHADYLTPRTKFHRMTATEQQAWNGKSVAIAAHNRAYFLAVNAAVARHQVKKEAV